MTIKNVLGLKKHHDSAIKQGYYVLESLRGVAAIAVIFGHFKIGGHLQYEFIKRSHLMVVFLVCRVLSYRLVFETV